MNPRLLIVAGLLTAAIVACLYLLAGCTVAAVSVDCAAHDAATGSEAGAPP